MDNYNVERLLGKGNYGSVYLATHKASGTDIALKTVPVEGMTADERERTMREVALLSHLAHPCVVRAWDAFIQDRHLHLVMEYCSGGDLGTVISSARRSHEMFTEVQILDWTAQILLALAHVHARRVLHRDLKAGNVFLTHSNTVRLGDFGIAKVLQNTLDAAKTVIGTPYYLSPEVCRNHPYDEKSDVWSLGCLVYELCSLRHAFSSDNLLALVFKIVQEGHPPLPPSTPASLMRLVDMLLCKDVARRPRAEQVLRLPVMITRLRAMAKGPVQDLAEHCAQVLQYLQEHPEPAGTPSVEGQPSIDGPPDDVTTVGLSAPQVQPMPLQRSTRIKSGLVEHAAHAVQVLSRPSSAASHTGGISAGAVIRAGIPDTIADSARSRPGSADAAAGPAVHMQALQRQDSDEDDEEEDIVPVVFAPHEIPGQAAQPEAQRQDAGTVTGAVSAHRRQATDLRSLHHNSSASSASLLLPASPAHLVGNATSPVPSRSSSAGSSTTSKGPGQGTGAPHLQVPPAAMGSGLSTIASGNTATSTPEPTVPIDPSTAYGIAPGSGSSGGSRTPGLQVESSPDMGGATSQSSGPRSGPLSAGAGRPPLQPYGRRRSVPGYQVVQQPPALDVAGSAGGQGHVAPTDLRQPAGPASPNSVGIEYRKPLSESELTYTPVPSSESVYGSGSSVGEDGMESRGQRGGMGMDGRSSSDLPGASMQRQSSGSGSAWPVYKGFMHSESPFRDSAAPATSERPGPLSVQHAAGQQGLPTAADARAAFLQRQHSEGDLSEAHRQYSLGGISSVQSEAGSYLSAGRPGVMAHGQGQGAGDSAAAGGGAMSAFGTSPFHYGYYPGGRPMFPAGGASGAAAGSSRGGEGPVSLWSASTYHAGLVASTDERDRLVDVSDSDLHMDDVHMRQGRGAFGNLYRSTSLPNPLLASPSPTASAQAFGEHTPAPPADQDKFLPLPGPVQPPIVRASSAPSPSRPSWSSNAPLPARAGSGAGRSRRTEGRQQAAVAHRAGDDYEPQLYSSTAHTTDDTYPSPPLDAAAASDEAGRGHAGYKGSGAPILARAQYTRDSHSSQGIASGGTKQRRNSAPSAGSVDSAPSGELSRAEWNFPPPARAPQQDGGRATVANARPSISAQGRPTSRPLGSHSPPTLQTQGLMSSPEVGGPSSFALATPDTGRPPVAVPTLPSVRTSSIRAPPIAVHGGHTGLPAVQLRTTSSGDVCSIDSRGNAALIGPNCSNGDGNAMATSHARGAGERGGTDTCPITLIPPSAHLKHIHAKCKRLKPLSTGTNTAAAATGSEAGTGAGGGLTHSTSARELSAIPRTTTAAFVHSNFAGGSAFSPSTGTGTGGSGLLYYPASSVGAASLSHGTTVKTTSSPSPYLEYGSTSGSGSGSHSAGGKSGLSMQQLAFEGVPGVRPGSGGQMGVAGNAEGEGRKGVSSRKGGFVPTAPPLLQVAFAAESVGAAQRTVGLVSTPRGMPLQGKRRTSGSGSTLKQTEAASSSVAAHVNTAGPIAHTTATATRSKGGEDTPLTSPLDHHPDDDLAAAGVAGDGDGGVAPHRGRAPQSSPESLPDLQLPAPATPRGPSSSKPHRAITRLAVPSLPSPAALAAGAGAGTPAVAPTGTGASPTILDSIRNLPASAGAAKLTAWPSSTRDANVGGERGARAGNGQGAGAGETGLASRIPRYHGHAQAALTTAGVGGGRQSATPRAGAFTVSSAATRGGGSALHGHGLGPPPTTAATPPTRAAMTPQAVSTSKASRWEDLDSAHAARSRLAPQSSAAVPMPSHPHRAGASAGRGHGAEERRAAQLRAQCRSELGPALFDKVYAFLHKRAVDRGEVPRPGGLRVPSSLTPLSQGSALSAQAPSGPHAAQDADVEGPGVSQSPETGGAPQGARPVKSAGTRRPEVSRVEMATKRQHSAGSVRKVSATASEELKGRHLRSQLKAVLGAGKEGMVESALRVHELLCLDNE